MTSLARRLLRVVIRAPLVACVTTACSDGTAPRVSAPIDASVTLEAVTPTTLTATVATAVLPSPAVRVRDKDGRPKAGVTVRFEFNYLTTKSTTSSVTDADGVASVPCVLGNHAGTGSLAAYVAGVYVPFLLTGIAGPVARIEHFGDTRRLGLVGANSDPIHAQVVDAYGNPVAGTMVRFTILQGGGSFASDTATSDAYGLASSGQWIPSDAGTSLAVARVGTVVSEPFEATALLPGSGGIDALYTLATIDAHAAAESKWTSSIALTSDGHWSALSRWDCCNGSVHTFQGGGRYAISGLTIVLSIDNGNFLEWASGPQIGEMLLLGSTTGATLALTWFVDGLDHDTIWAYQRAP